MNLVAGLLALKGFVNEFISDQVLVNQYYNILNLVNKPLPVCYNGFSDCFSPSGVNKTTVFSRNNACLPASGEFSDELKTVRGEKEGKYFHDAFSGMIIYRMIIL